MSVFRTAASRWIAGVVCVIAGCLVACAGAASASSSSSGAIGSRAQIEDVICQTALDPPARAFSVTAQMKPIAGTQHMELEFDLQVSTASTPAFTDVAGSGLGTWLTPPNANLGQRPGDIWVLHHPVANLTAPAVYRFIVSFRWLGA